MGDPVAIDLITSVLLLEIVLETPETGSAGSVLDESVTIGIVLGTLGSI